MAPLEVDLRASALKYDRAGIRPRRILLLILGAFGVAMVVAGVGLGLALTHAFLLVGGGIAIMTAVVWGWRRMPQVSDRMTLSGDGIQFRRFDGQVLSLRWNSSDSKLRIYDWRGIPPNGRSKGLQGVEFVLNPSLPVEVPVEREVVAAILDEAKRHGYVVAGWEETRPMPSPVRIVILTPPKIPSKHVGA